MTTKQQSRTTTEPKSIRVSISFPPELYETLEYMAKERKVSVAWVVRDAAEKYVVNQWPLLERNRQDYR